MADFPADGHITDAARTVSEVQNDMDAWLASTKELPGGSLEQVPVVATTLTVSAPIVFVSGSGAVTVTDIASSDLQQGRAIVLIRPWGPSSLTIAHGVNKIHLRDAASAVLSGSDSILLIWNQGAGYWSEITRSQSSPGETQTWLGLGSAAYIDEGSGNGLDADTLDGVEGAGYLQVGAKADDAEKLDGINSDGFVHEKAAGTPQSTGTQFLAGPLVVEGSAIGVDAPAAATAKVQGSIDGTTEIRWGLQHDGSEMLLRSWDISGVLQSALRSVDGVGTLEVANEFAEPGVFRSIWPGAGNGLDADKLDGLELAEVQVAHGSGYVEWPDVNGNLVVLNYGWSNGGFLTFAKPYTTVWGMAAGDTDDNGVYNNAYSLSTSGINCVSSTRHGYYGMAIGIVVP